MQEMETFILRGIMGSGKSTWADKKKGEHKPGEVDIVSSDDYFMVNGKYEFDARKLIESHGECLRRFIDIIRDEKDWAHRRVKPRKMLIVDNTNTTVAEISPYVAISEAYGFKVRIVTFEVPVLLAAKRNIHGVGEEQLLATSNRLDQNTANFPRRWNSEIVRHNG